jgi:hypothetical protein
MLYAGGHKTHRMNTFERILFNCFWCFPTLFSCAFSLHYLVDFTREQSALIGLFIFYIEVKFETKIDKLKEKQKLKSEFPNGKPTF